MFPNIIAYEHVYKINTVHHHTKEVSLMTPKGILEAPFCWTFCKKELVKKGRGIEI